MVPRFSQKNLKPKLTFARNLKPETFSIPTYLPIKAQRFFLQRCQDPRP